MNQLSIKGLQCFRFGFRGRWELLRLQRMFWHVAPDPYDELGGRHRALGHLRCFKGDGRVKFVVLNIRRYVQPLAYNPEQQGRVRRFQLAPSNWMRNPILHRLLNKAIDEIPEPGPIRSLRINVHFVSFAPRKGLPAYELFQEIDTLV